MIAICASLVGWRSAREMPRIMSPLALHAKRGGAAVDRVGPNEPGTAPAARKTGPSIRLELFDEGAAFAARVPVIPKARATRFDRFLEDSDDRVAK
jgi:hypothetical protein